MIVSADKATLYELQTIYSIGDAHKIAEVISVDRYNEALKHADNH
jgi:hypothetical protein